MRRVLVTGAFGFIGRRVAPALGRDAWDVLTLSRNASDDASLHLDLGGSLASIPPVDAVVHLAGGYAGAGLRELRRDDVRIAENLLSWGARAGVERWVFASAAEVYGACPQPVSESAALRPVLPYGRVKVEVERLFASLAGSHDETSVAILRIGEVYGPQGNLLVEVTRRLKRGFCPWFGTGQAPVSFIHVEDVATAVRAALAGMPAGLSVWNVADDEPVTWAEFLREVAGHVGKGRVVRLPIPLSRLYAASSTAADRARGRRPLVTQHAVTLLTTPKVMSNRKLKDELGVTPVHGAYRDGLAAHFANSAEPPPRRIASP